MQTYAKEPVKTLKASGSVIDLVVVDQVLYAATDNGIVDIFSISSGKKIKTIGVPEVKDFMGDLIPAKVFSVDVTSDRNQVLLVCQGKSGFRNVYQYIGGNLIKIFDAEKDKLMVKKARYVDDETILLGLLSNEIILFDLNTKTPVYKKQISTSSFADFILSEDHKSFITSDESGIIRMFNTETGNLIKELKGENVDNVYQVDMKSNIIIGGGQDRRVSVYYINTASSYHLKSDFLIYSIGLSPDGKTGAFQRNEENEIGIFNIETRQITEVLIGHKTTLTKILFLTNTELVTASDDPEILIWEL